MSETRSRRRGAQLEQAILDAAWDELREVGYARLTIEAVAARAGTSKPVIYRRWAGRAELALAAWFRQVPVPQGVLDTGTLRGDLLVLFSRIARRADSMMNEVVAGVMGEAFRHPEIAALLHDRLTRPSPLTSAVETIVGNAVARAELPPLDLPERVKRLPLDLIRNESTLCGTPLTDETLASLVDDVYVPLLHGLAALQERALRKRD
ncbi:TetR family transcriptional regulator [Saccharothrix sp. ALI-22-I]|uniref:TetR/AcrR family transcriptional regulator n=1 Tax=Saccharothrix sp. ALI-22-I TaxID=1933778 RepID=UPI00097CB333|nr:TetR/AcrR family transcriptional regulator [Saccharothrix sp. ALI-22-I]ONI84812.1 TetR family transcriptional regulator [Saccharothrix sp. ALI-22-I]